MADHLFIPPTLATPEFGGDVGSSPEWLGNWEAWETRMITGSGGGDL